MNVRLIGVGVRFIMNVFYSDYAVVEFCTVDSSEIKFSIVPTIWLILGSQQYQGNLKVYYPTGRCSIFEDVESWVEMKKPIMPDYFRPYDCFILNLTGINTLLV